MHYPIQRLAKNCQKKVAGRVQDLYEDNKFRIGSGKKECLTLLQWYQGTKTEVVAVL